MRKRSAAVVAVLVFAASVSAAMAADRLPYQSAFSVTYTFTTSTPARPIDVGATKDLTVNTYLATTINDAGSGFLHQVAGHCINIRFTDRSKNTIDSRGYCNFKDKDGDVLYVEYTTDGARPSDQIVNKGRFVSGTGQYEGITGEFEGENSNNLDADGGSYMATGKMVGSYRIVRGGGTSAFGLHD